MKLEELLNYMEFDYKINPNGTLSLVDLTGTNLNNIESEEFKLNTDLALNVLDRLDHYIDDYFLDDFVENLRKHDEENFKAKGYDEFYYGEDIIALADEYGDAFKDDRYDLVYAVVNPETVEVDSILNKNESVKKMSKISKLTENLESLIKNKKAIKENEDDMLLYAVTSPDGQNFIANDIGLLNLIMKEFPDVETIDIFDNVEFLQEHAYTVEDFYLSDITNGDGIIEFFGR